MFRRLLCSAVFVCVIGRCSAFAQEPSNVPAPLVDVGDVWHMVRHHPPAGESAGSGQRSILFAPAISSSPTTGLTFGLKNEVQFVAGEANATRISTFSANVKVSENRQTVFSGTLALFTADDRWFVLSENRFSWTSGAIYALGSDAPASSALSLKYNVLKFYESAYRRVRPGLFIGAGLNLSSRSNVRPADAAATAAWNASAYVGYADAHGFSSTLQTSSGPGVSVRYDTRNSQINADKGILASATYRTFFKGLLGGSSTWQELALDVRTYRKITEDARHKIAFWFMSDLVTGGTAPFWDLPANGTDFSSARGYKIGRYRGQHLLYWETEYRGTLTRNGLLGMVVFANATTVDNVETHERLFRSFAPAAGLGLRVLFNKHSHTNLAADWAWGKQGSHGFYLGIREAF